jgi:hypothetical protein
MQSSFDITLNQLRNDEVPIYSSPDDTQSGFDWENTLTKLKGNDPSLTCLSLDSIKISQREINALASALEKNKCLITLSLENTCIQDEGAKSLAKMLKTNTSLKYLHLKGNQIKKEGIECLSEALKTNTSLKDLDLSGNDIGDDAVTYLLKMLAYKQSLERLYIIENNIGIENKIKILEAKKMSSLCLIGLGLDDLDLDLDEESSVGDRYFKENYDNTTTEQNSSCCTPFNMQILGGFISVLGIATVAVALTVLSGGVAIFVAGAGVGTLLFGLGLFADATIGKTQRSEPVNENSMII